MNTLPDPLAPQAVEKPDAKEMQKLNAEQALEQIEIVRSRTPTPDEQAQIDRMAAAASIFIEEVVSWVPDTKEREIALNNTLSAMLWSRHGILRARIEMGKVEVPEGQ